PPLTPPLQTVCPAVVQVPAQLPDEQEAVPAGGPVQAWLQLPHLAASVCRSLQKPPPLTPPLHTVCPVVVQVPAQLPDEQEAVPPVVPVQAWLQVPQLAASPSRRSPELPPLTPPLQTVCPVVVQVPAQLPDEQEAV